MLRAYKNIPIKIPKLQFQTYYSDDAFLGYCDYNESANILAITDNSMSRIAFLSFVDNIPEQKYIKTKEIDDSINCMSLNTEGTEILYSFGEHSFILWNIESGKIIYENNSLSEKIRCICAISNHIFFLSTSTNIYCYNTNDNSLSLFSNKHTDQISSLYWLNGTNYLLSADKGGCLKIWTFSVNKYNHVETISHELMYSFYFTKHTKPVSISGVDVFSDLGYISLYLYEDSLYILNMKTLISLSKTMIDLSECSNTDLCINEFSNTQNKLYHKSGVFLGSLMPQLFNTIAVGGEQDDLFIYNLQSKDILYQQLILSDIKDKSHIVSIKLLKLDPMNAFICVTTDIAVYLLTTASYMDIESDDDDDEEETWMTTGVHSSYGVCTDTDYGVCDQQVYICKTCIEMIDTEKKRTSSDKDYFITGGLCEQCANWCHARQGHTVVSLGLKSHFQCDCGNNLFPFSIPCQLTTTKPFHPSNIYTHNFRDKWCYCNGDNIPPLVECIKCHDWFHQHCIDPSFPWDDPTAEFICRDCQKKYNLESCVFIMSQHENPINSTSITKDSVSEISKNPSMNMQSCSTSSSISSQSLSSYGIKESIESQTQLNESIHPLGSTQKGSESIHNDTSIFTKPQPYYDVLPDFSEISNTSSSLSNITQQSASTNCGISKIQKNSKNKSTEASSLKSFKTTIHTAKKKNDKGTAFKAILRMLMKSATENANNSERGVVTSIDVQKAVHEMTNNLESNENDEESYNNNDDDIDIDQV